MIAGVAEATDSGADHPVNSDINYAVFVGEVSEQCRFVLMAVRELEQLEGLDRSLHRLSGRRFLEKQERFGFPPNHSAEAVEFDLISKLVDLQGVGLYERLRQIRYHVDNIVDHVSRIEKLLWPAHDRRRARGEELRRRLGMADSSTLPESIRALRNGWQHMDERIDEHFAVRRSGTDVEDEEPESSPTGFRFGREESALVLEAQGERLELDPVIDEVRVLLARCQLERRTFDEVEMAPFYRMQLEE